ncbi:MAG: D-alanyl-D-alanine carboxypeptidase/D-alanyl-D-alanine-endopeptidase [Rhabdochlamydiaceae bacterium]|nr:D-alanyl-D-alanine carboxypeptidase/D-alanyl-D-alanine-endopeptidase [Candidatus Amphrikana amoebophyrae]
MKLRKFLILLLIPAASLFSSTHLNIEAAFDKMCEHPLLKKATIGFCLLDPSTDESIFEANSEKSLMPASLTKLFTTAAALELLGPNMQFSTKLCYQGKIEDRMLTGDIIILGDGDPTLGSDRFDLRAGDLLLKWRLAIEEAGITNIRGRVVGDGSCFDNALQVPTCLWEDLGCSYGAGSSGLSFNENRYELEFKPGDRIGEKAKLVTSSPYIPQLTFISEVVTGSEGSGDNTNIFGCEYGDVQHVRGAIPKGQSSFKVRGAISNPPFYCAQSLHDALDRELIFISCKPKSAKDYNLISSYRKVVIDETFSPKLKAVVKEMNKNSINLYADHLFKKMGQMKSGVGSYESGGKAVMSYLKSLDLDTTGISIKDGSGLSVYNLISAKQMTQFLSKMRDQENFLYFYESLPKAGTNNSEGGTLIKFGLGTCLVGNLVAKTGSNSRVFCLAGYIQNEEFGEMPFALLINNCLTSKSKLHLMVSEFLEEIVSLSAKKREAFASQTV